MAARRENGGLFVKGWSSSHERHTWSWYVVWEVWVSGDYWRVHLKALSSTAGVRSRRGHCGLIAAVQS